MKARENLRKRSRVEKEIKKIDASVAAAQQKVLDDERRLTKALADVQIVIQASEDQLDHFSIHYFPHRAKLLAQQLKALNAKDERKDFDPEDQDEMHRLRYAWQGANCIGSQIYLILQKRIAETANKILRQDTSEELAAALKILEPVWTEFCERRVRWT